MLFVRSLAFNVLFYAVLITMLVIGIPLTAAPPQTVRNYARRWGAVSTWMLARICNTRIEIRGAENLPSGGFMLASKHQSFLDIIALLPLLPRFTYVMKKELTRVPLFGALVLRAGMIPIDRTRGRAVMGELTRQVGVAVRDGCQLIIFPEGTRRPAGAEAVYKSGVAHLYADLGVPCVPVALNSGLFWPRRTFLRFPGTVVIEIMPPIAPGLPKAAFQAELQATIEAASDRLLAEADIRQPLAT